MYKEILLEKKCAQIIAKYPKHWNWFFVIIIIIIIVIVIIASMLLLTWHLDMCAQLTACFALT